MIISEEMHAHNTFDAPNAVEAKAFDGVKVADGKLSVKVPACSVLHIVCE